MIEKIKKRRVKDYYSISSHDPDDRCFGRHWDRVLSDIDWLIAKVEELEMEDKE